MATRAKDFSGTDLQKIQAAIDAGKSDVGDLIPGAVLIDNSMITYNPATITFDPDVKMVRHVELSGVNIAFNDNGASADTIVRASGSFITDGWIAGDSVKVSGSAANNGTYTIDAVTSATVLTLVAKDALTTASYTSGVTLLRLMI